MTLEQEAFAELIIQWHREETRIPSTMNWPEAAAWKIMDPSFEHVYDKGDKLIALWNLKDDLTREGLIETYVYSPESLTKLTKKGEDFQGFEAERQNQQRKKSREETEAFWKTNPWLVAIISALAASIFTGIFIFMFQQWYNDKNDNSINKAPNSKSIEKDTLNKKK